MSDGGQINRGEILTLQQVVETVLGTERALLLQNVGFIIVRTITKMTLQDVVVFSKYSFNGDRISRSNKCYSFVSPYDSSYTTVEFHEASLHSTTFNAPLKEQTALLGYVLSG